MSATDELRAVLEPACAAWFDTATSVEGLRRLTGGASQETWSFDVRLPTGELRALILRKDRPGPSFGLNRRGEYDLLQAAAAAGVTVPKVLFFLPDAGGGAAYAMERVDGETIAPKLLRDPRLEAARHSLASRCGEELARIHAIDPSVVPSLPRAPANVTPVAHQLGIFRQIYESHDEPHPAIELGFRWLAEKEPPSERIGVVHGDFRCGNLIVAPDGLRAVLDWELAHIGDPMEDLGWLCVRSWRFGHDALPVGGFGTREALFEAYEKASCRAVDPDRVWYWEAYGNLKWAVICMMQAAAHYRAIQPSVELAAIGRRTCEAEWDLLQLIG